MELLILLKDVWKSWNLRGLVLFSFSLQCILFIGSSWRIKSSKGWVHVLIWLAYLLADSAAYYAIGLIIPGGSVYTAQDQRTFHIHSFWAPFLLFHIAGPYNIAGFALEDNKLWSRSVLHLVVQGVATGYVIYLSTIPENLLLAPMLMMFFAALTRYVGKIYALYKASPDEFRSSFLNEKYVHRSYEGDKPNLSMVTNSHFLFRKSKAIFAGFSIFSKLGDNMDSRGTSLKDILCPHQDANQVFTIMEIQMSLAYDLFYTKIWSIIEYRIGALVHLISSMSEVGALVLWVYAHKHGRYKPVDIRITNIILIGGVVIDVYSMMMLLLSYQMIPRLLKLSGRYSPVFARILEKVLLARYSKYGRCLFMVTHWSRSIKQFDFSHYAEHRKSHSKRRIRLEELTRPITGYDTHVSTTELSDELINYIFMEIKQRFLYFKSKSGEHSTKVLISGTLTGYLEDKYGSRRIMEIVKSWGLLHFLLIQSYGYHGCQKYNTAIIRYLTYLIFRQPNMILDGMQFKVTLEFLTFYMRALSEDDNALRQIEKYASDFKRKAEAGTEPSVKIMEDLVVDLLLYVAIHCRTWIHMEQLGKGGELLTIVWLMMSFLGFTIEPFEFYDQHYLKIQARDEDEVPSS